MFAVVVGARRVSGGASNCVSPGNARAFGAPWRNRGRIAIPLSRATPRVTKPTPSLWPNGSEPRCIRPSTPCAPGCRAPFRVGSVNAARRCGRPVPSAGSKPPNCRTRACRPRPGCRGRVRTLRVTPRGDHGRRESRRQSDRLESICRAVARRQRRSRPSQGLVELAGVVSDGAARGLTGSSALVAGAPGRPLAGRWHAEVAAEGSRAAADHEAGVLADRCAVGHEDLEDRAAAQPPLERAQTH
jgi:hypothetical protein